MPNIYNKEGISFNNVIKPYNKLGFEGPFHPFINNAESDMTLSEYLSTNRSTANTGEYFTTNAIDIHWGGAVLPNFNGGSRTINTTSQLLEAIQAASNIGGSSTVASSNTLGLIKIGYTTSGNNRAVVLDSNNKAYVDISHNHDLKIETTTNSTSVTLAHDTAYKLTAGGKEYNFKTPTNYVHPTKSTTEFTAPDGKYIKKITLDNTGHVDAVTYATIPTPEIYANDLRVSKTNDFNNPTVITSLTLAPGESKIVYVKTFPYYGGEKATTEGRIVFGTSSDDNSITVSRLSGEEVLQGTNMVISNNVFKITAKDTITSTISNLKAYFRLKYNYGVSNEVDITVQPGQSKQNLTNFSVSMSGWTYGGTATNPSVSGNTGNGTVTYQYKVSNDNDSTYTSTKPSNAGTYTVKATVEETTNYYGATATANFTIAKANINPTVSMSGWTYGGTASSPLVGGNTGNGAVTYQYKVSTAAGSTYESNKPSNAGTYTVQAIVAETTNYYGATAIANFTIAKANINPTVSMSGWTEGQTASDPSVSGNTGNGTVTYQYKVSTAADSTYTSNKPSTAGTYTVKASIAATTNYNAGTATTNFIISAAQSQTTYYWYAGQTDPSTMTTISPIVTSYENGGGWYELGTTLPTSINQLVKGGTTGNIWYVAVPADANLVPGSSADPDTSVTTGSTKLFNNVTYQIYIYEGVTGTRASFELNR